MTRERFEQILFAHVNDEVVQDMLNQYVLELESSNAKLRELMRDMWGWLTARTVSGAALHDISGRMRELGVEVNR